MSESPLSTHAGPIAVIAGGLFAITHVGQFLVMDPSNLVTMMLNPAFRLFSAAYAITFPLMVSQASWSTLTPNSTSDKPAPGRPDRLRTPGKARLFPGHVGRQSVKTSVDRCATRFVDQLSSMANRQGGRHRLARPAQGVGSAETGDGDQLQLSRRRVLAAPRAANASTCRNASRPHSAWSPFVGPSLMLVRPRVTT